MLYIAMFVAFLLSMRGLISSAVSSWRIMFDYISTIESLRFWFALISFIGFVSLVTAGIIGGIIALGVRIAISIGKKSKQPC